MNKKSNLNTILEELNNLSSDTINNLSNDQANFILERIEKIKNIIKEKSLEENKAQKVRGKKVDSSDMKDWEKMFTNTRENNIIYEGSYSNNYINFLDCGGSNRKNKGCSFSYSYNSPEYSSSYDCSSPEFSLYSGCGSTFSGGCGSSSRSC